MCMSADEPVGHSGRHPLSLVARCGLFGDFRWRPAGASQLAHSSLRSIDEPPSIACLISMAIAGWPAKSDKTSRYN